MSLKGKVIVGGKNPSVSACGEKKNLRQVHPYGIYFVYPNGENIELDEKKILGSVDETDERENLEAGEILIKSMGGAKIVLKNDGKVVINGREC